MNALAQVVSSNPDKQPDPGSVRLRNPKYEAYARERAVCTPPLEAARKSGWPSITAANAIRLDRHKLIAARIDWLTRQEEDLLRTKRAKLEAFWWGAIECDIADYWEEAERIVRDSDGNPVLGQDGTPILETYSRLKSFDQLEREHRLMIEGLTFTEKGKPNLKLVGKSQANIELRKMLGLDAPAKSALDVNHSGTVTLEALVLASYAPPVAPEEPQTIEHSEP